MKPGLLIALLVGVELIMSGILMHPAGLSLAALAAFGAGVAFLVVSKLLKKAEPPKQGHGSSWHENLTVAAVGTLLLSLAAFLVVGVSYWFWGAGVWAWRHYEAYKPVVQSWELSGGERLGGNVVTLPVAVKQGTRISFYWRIDCAATSLPSDCNNWVTRTGNNGCDFSRVVGGQSGSFIAESDMNVVVLAKTPSVDTPVSTPCVPQNDAFIPMLGRVGWYAGAYGGH